MRAVDPATVGRQLAAKRLAATSVSVEFIGLNAGLRVAPLAKFYAKGPEPFGYLFEGVATNVS